MRQVLLFAAAGLLTVNMAAAQDSRSLPPEAQSLIACYLATATSIGKTACERPSALTGEVFEKCSGQEQALIDAVKIRYKGLPDMIAGELAKASLKKIREKMASQVQSWILKSRIKEKICQGR